MEDTMNKTARVLGDSKARCSRRSLNRKALKSRHLVRVNGSSNSKTLAILMMKASY